MIQTAEALTDLYEADETAWLEAMAELIAEGKQDEVDYAHLQEYLTDMANRDKREVESRLSVLMMHVLKWTHQKKKRSKSWRRTIVNQRRELTKMLKSGVLRKHAGDALAAVYRDAVDDAVLETGLPTTEFPRACPYTVQMLLADDLLDR